jgi:hypothetical protein
MRPSPEAESIRSLNDAFRRSFSGGRVMLTASVAELPDEEREAILAKVRVFDAFDRDNDPQGEHDFGLFEHLGTIFFWKIDNCVPGLAAGSEHPADEGLPRTFYSLRHTYISFRLLEGANIVQLAWNCRTSVEMIEKYYADHIKTRVDAAAINGRPLEEEKI